MSAKTPGAASYTWNQSERVRTLSSAVLAGRGSCAHQVPVWVAADATGAEAVGVATGEFVTGLWSLKSRELHAANSVSAAQTAGNVRVMTGGVGVCVAASENTARR